MALPDFWPDLGQRSYQPELLDAEDLPRADLYQNLYELEIINRWLGGHQLTIKGLSELLGLGCKGQGAYARSWTLADVGCGGGDSLRVIADWARQQGLRLELTGIDLKPECLDYAREHSAGYQIEWIQADYRQLERSFDIVTCSLFCHHLNDQQLLEYFAWLRRQARFGFIINDLQRHPLAYYGIQALTQVFSRSRLVRHDAPLSVWRGFQRQELQALLSQSALHPRIQAKWAFRYLVAGYL